MARALALIHARCVAQMVYGKPTRPSADKSGGDAADESDEDFFKPLRRRVEQVADAGEVRGTRASPGIFASAWWLTAVQADATRSALRAQLRNWEDREARRCTAPMRSLPLRGAKRPSLRARAPGG